MRCGLRSTQWFGLWVSKNHCSSERKEMAKELFQGQLASWEAKFKLPLFSKGLIPDACSFRMTNRFKCPVSPDKLTSLISLSLQPIFAYELYSVIRIRTLSCIKIWSFKNKNQTQFLQAQILQAGNLSTLTPFSSDVPRKTKPIPPYLQTDYFLQREYCRSGCGWGISEKNYEIRRAT